MAPKVASAFLSYGSSDETLVRAVAGELVVRGVFAWLAPEALPAGKDLPTRLQQAICAQRAVVLFVSLLALESKWVREELDEALKLERDGKKESIIPVFVEPDFARTIRSYPPLRDAWMDAEHERVTRSGVRAASRDPGAIATEIATAIYKLVGTREAPELLVAFEHRGSGKPGADDLPESLQHLECPALRSFSDLEERSKKGVIARDRWGATSAAMRWSLSQAIDLAPRRPQRIHWFGNCQMASAALFGSVASRSSGKILVLWDREGASSIDLDLRPYRTPLTEGVAAQASGDGVRGVAIAITKAGHLNLPELRRDAKKRGFALAEVIAPDDVRSAEQIVEVARNVTATFGRLDEPRQSRRLHLYNLSAAHLLVGVVSLLELVVPEIVIMEWIDDRKKYSPYKLPK